MVVRRERPAAFNFSFLDIMTALLAVGLIMLICASLLFSLAPFRERFMEPTKDMEEQNARLVDRIATVQASRDSLRILETELNAEAASLFDGNTTQASTRFLPESRPLTRTETEEIVRLREEVAALMHEVSLLSPRVGVLRERFVKRRTEWLQEMMSTDLALPLRTRLVPLFYRVSYHGIMDFETGSRMEVSDVVAKHRALPGTYPAFIIEPSGFDWWAGTVRKGEEAFLDAEIAFGYEPYNSSLAVIYDVFLIEAP